MVTDSDVLSHNVSAPLYAATSLAPGGGMPWFVADSFASTISLLRSLGYAGIDLLLRDPDDARDAGVTDILDANGLSLCSVVTGPARRVDGLSLSDPQTAGMAVDRVRRHVEFARDPGAKVILGWMLGALPDDESRGLCEATLVSSLRECADVARSYGVEVLLEPLNRYESNVIRTAEDAIQLIARVGGGLGILLDTFHMNIEEADPVQTAQDVGELARHVHLADSNRQVPGRGHFPFSRFLEQLRASGFAGTFAIEALPVPDIHTAAASAMATWHET